MVLLEAAKEERTERSIWAENDRVLNGREAGFAQTGIQQIEVWRNPK
jgi:hypothetical protein